MEDIKKGINFMKIYNSKKTTIVCIILSILVASICILMFPEDKTSADYIAVIKFLCYSFGLFIFGLTNFNYFIRTDEQNSSKDIIEILNSNGETTCSSKFIGSSNLGKGVYTNLNIIYSNIIGVIFIVIFTISKLMLSTFNIGNVDNLVDSVYVLFALLGFLVLCAAIANRIRFLYIFSYCGILPMYIAISHKRFMGIIFFNNLFNNNKIFIILLGIAIWAVLNLLAYLSANSIYNEKKIIR